MPGTTQTQGECSLFCMIYPKGDFFRSCKIPVVHLWTETQYYCMSKTNAFFTQ